MEIKANKETTLEIEEIRCIVNDVNLTEEEKVTQLDRNQRGYIHQAYFQSFLFVCILATIVGGIFILKPSNINSKGCNVNHDSLAIEQGDSIIFNRNQVTNDVLKHFHKDTIN